MHHLNTLDVASIYSSTQLDFHSLQNINVLYFYQFDLNNLLCKPLNHIDFHVNHINFDISLTFIFNRINFCENALKGMHNAREQSSFISMSKCVV